MRLRVLMLAVLVVGLIPLAAQPVRASSQIVLSGGGDVSHTFSCGGASCGPILTSQGVFNLSIDFGLANNFPPSLSLNSTNSVVTVPADITIAYSLNNLTASAAAYLQSFTANLFGNGAPPPTSATFTTYYNANNMLGGMTTSLGTQSLSTTSTLNASADNIGGSFLFGPGPYSLTLVFTLHDTMANANQQLTGAFLIPEPATLGLMGAALIGLAVALRRGLRTVNN